MRVCLTAALQQAGFVVNQAGNAADALALAETFEPDLILSDIVMAQGDGFMLLSKLRAQVPTATTPVVLMTGDAELATLNGLRHGMELGADDFLRKPFTPDVLLAAVRARLRKQDLLAAQADRDRAWLNQMLEATHDIVLFVRVATQQVAYLNLAGRQALGGPEGARFSLGELLGSGAAQQLVSVCLPQAREQNMWRGEISIRCKSGLEVATHAVVQLHKTDDGHEEYFSMVANPSDGAGRPFAGSPRMSDLNIKSLTVAGLDGVAVIKQDGRFVFTPRPMRGL